MTAQINDVFRYRNREYAVAGISEGDLFDPTLLCLEPAGTSTACWRGYQAIFGLSGSLLVLDALHVNLLKPGEGYKRREGPPINGIEPCGPRDEHGWFNNHYEGLDYHLTYTGGLLIADGFIERLYVHMGFHPAWKYKKVVELVFDLGILKNAFDRSREMVEIRREFLALRAGDDPSRPTSEDEIMRFVERAFDRTYPR